MTSPDYPTSDLERDNLIYIEDSPINIQENRQVYPRHFYRTENPLSASGYTDIRT